MCQYRKVSDNASQFKGQILHIVSFARRVSRNIKHPAGLSTKPREGECTNNKLLGWLAGSLAGRLTRGTKLMQIKH